MKLITSQFAVQVFYWLNHCLLSLSILTQRLFSSDITLKCCVPSCKLDKHSKSDKFLSFDSFPIDQQLKKTMDCENPEGH